MGCQGPRPQPLLFSSRPVGTVDVGKARLMFWDLGGQEELQSLWDKVRGGWPHRLPACLSHRPSRATLVSPCLSWAHLLSLRSAAWLLSRLCCPSAQGAVPRTGTCWVPGLAMLWLLTTGRNRGWPRGRRGEDTAPVWCSASAPGPELPCVPAQDLCSRRGRVLQGPQQPPPLLMEV